MIFKRRSIGKFKVMGCIGGLAFILIAAAGIKGGIDKGLPLEGWISILFIGLLGIILLTSVIIMYFYLGNANADKIDESIQISYDVTYRGNTRLLEDISVLSQLLGSLAPGEEISIHLNPEYFGLMDWKFIKIKNYYISFVWIHKKEKKTQYFIMPRSEVSMALKPFMEVFVEHKAVNTSNLISMKKYQAVLDYYKLR